MAATDVSFILSEIAITDRACLLSENQITVFDCLPHSSACCCNWFGILMLFSANSFYCLQDRFRYYDWLFAPLPVMLSKSDNGVAVTPSKCFTTASAKGCSDCFSILKEYLLRYHHC